MENLRKGLTWNYHFELDLDNEGEHEKLFPSVCIAWAYIIQQYISRHLIIFVAEAKIRSTNGEESVLSKSYGIEQHHFKFCLEKEGSISKAYSQLQDHFSPRYLIRNGTTRVLNHEFELGFTTVEAESIGKSQQDDLSILMNCVPSQTGVQMTINIQQDFTCRIQGSRMVRQFKFALDRLLKTTVVESTFCETQMVPPEDIQELRWWNSYVPRPEQTCFGQAIEMQALQHPYAQAISAWDGSLSYKQLDTLSSSLASFLVDRGVKPETFIPLCFERSLYAIIALVAVTKAGGAFVLLDPGQPLQRLKSITNQVRADTCLLSETQYQRWTSSNKMKGLDPLKIHGPFLDALPQRRVPENLGPDPGNACYVGFTSGSTGEPKGVVIEHRNVMTFSNDIRKHLRLQCEPIQSRVFQFASHAFDATIGEVIPTLTAGACLCIPSEESRSSDLAEAMNSLEVDVAILTPSVLKALQPSQVPHLRTLHVVGEAPNAKLIHDWADKVRMNNAYGPSECSVSCVSNTSLSSSDDGRNIGFADSCSTWIVDPDNSDILVPIGAVGELLIEGPLVGRGYLGDEERTNASFIQDPPWLGTFRSGFGHRLYKTGDLVRYASDGSLTYSGRKDTQVKIRGQRLELTEVEIQICRSHSDIQDAVADVITPAGSQSVPLLIAFVTLKSTEAQHNDYFSSVIEKVENELGSKLPRHMVPAAFIPLSRVPLSSVSSKTDRKALRELASSKTITQLQRAYRKDSACSNLNSREVLLQQLWCEALCLEDEIMTDTDSFFRLGGDSIRAMQLCKAAKSWGWDISVADIFRHPTLGAMARLLHQTTAGSHKDSPTIPADVTSQEDIVTTGSVPPLCNGLAGSLVRIEKATDVQEDAITQALLPFQGGILYVVFDISGPLDVDRLQAAFHRLTEWHEALRTVFFLQENQLCQGVLPDYDPIFKVSVQDLPVRAKNVKIQEPYESELREVQLFGKPSLRLLLFKYDDGDHRLIMRICHASIDGMSMNRFQSDLRTAYMGLDHVNSPSFCEYTSRARAQGSETSHTYWRKLLAGSVMTEIVSHTVPDYVHRANRTLSHSTSTRAIQVEGIEITSASLVKAAWALVLAQLTGHVDVIFGHLVSGRNVAMTGCEDVVGPCIADVPVRVQFRPSWKAKELLLSVQDQYYHGIPHETLGFPTIVRECTHWPPWTRLSSYLQFQSVDAEQAFRLSDDVECSLWHWEANLDAADIYIMVTPRDTMVDIELSFSDEVIPESVAQHALHLLCKYIDALACADSDIQGLLRREQGSPQLPIPNENAEYVTGTEFLDLDRGEVERLQEDILDVWSQVLPPGWASKGPIGIDTSFFDRGGDFPRLVYLAEMLKSRGLELAIEDLVYRPTVKSQIAIILQQRRLSRLHHEPTLPQYRPNAAW